MKKTVLTTVLVVLTVGLWAGAGYLIFWPARPVAPAPEGGCIVEPEVTEGAAIAAVCLSQALADMERSYQELLAEYDASHARWSAPGRKPSIPFYERYHWANAAEK